MMIFRRLMAVLAALMLLCSLAAAQSPEDVMATVNGTPITRQAFEGYLNNLTAYYAYYGYDVTTPENAAALRYMALDTLVQLTLMDQKIAEVGLVSHLHLEVSLDGKAVDPLNYLPELI